MFKYIFSCFFIIGFIFTAPLQAQDSEAQYMNQLQLLNQTPIARSPLHKTDQDMFSMRVIDKNRQLVGKVADIAFDESGAMVKLVSDINRIGRRESIVRNDAFEVIFHEDISAFEIPLVLSPGDVRDISPEALAAIAPAAGGGSVYSLKAMLGADVRSRDGRWVGIVKNVIFDEQGQAIRALLVEDVPRARRYKDIALPFDPQQIKVNSDYGRVEFRAEPAAAKAIMDFAKSSR